MVDVVHPFPAQDGRHDGPDEALPLRWAHLHADGPGCGSSGGDARCLTGHAGGGGVGRGYGGCFGLKVMAAEMVRIEAPEALKGLQWADAVGRASCENANFLP